MRAWTCHSVPFCEGWRPVDHGTPTHAEWPMRLFSCFFRLCHSTWVGIPLFTGRQPTRNVQRDFFPVFCVVPFCVGWRPVVHGTPTHAEWPMRLVSCLKLFENTFCKPFRNTFRTLFRNTFHMMFQNIFCKLFWPFTATMCWCIMPPSALPAHV